MASTFVFKCRYGLHTPNRNVQKKQDAVADINIELAFRGKILKTFNGLKPVTFPRACLRR